MPTTKQQPAFKKRIEKESWEMPEWMEKNFLDFFSGYPKEDVERHVNSGDEVTVFNNAPLALTCVAHKSVKDTLERIHERGLTQRPKFTKADRVLAKNTRKSPPVFEPATVTKVVGIWKGQAPVYEYTVEFDHLKGLKNRRVTVNDLQIKPLTDDH